MDKEAFDIGVQAGIDSVLDKEAGINFLKLKALARSKANVVRSKLGRQARVTKSEADELIGRHYKDLRRKQGYSSADAMRSAKDSVYSKYKVDRMI